MSQQFEIGDRVYCMVYGQYGTVESTTADAVYPVQVLFDVGIGHSRYTVDGRYYLDSKFPCLFFDKPQFKIPQKPSKPTYKNGAVLVLQSTASSNYWIIEVKNTSFYEGKEEIYGICRASSLGEDVGYPCQKTLDLYSISVISEPSE